MSCPVALRERDGVLELRVPLYVPFVNEARLIGRWNGPFRVWQFSLDKGDRLRKLLRRHYGCDGESRCPPMVLARVDLSGWWEERDLFLFGRRVLRRAHPNAAVHLGYGVSVLRGEFDSSAVAECGAPALGYLRDVVLLVEEVHEPLVRPYRQQIAVLQAAGEQ